MEPDLNFKPPKWLNKIARLICAPHLREELLGDLQERYTKRVQRDGKRIGNIAYMNDVFSLLRIPIVKRKPIYHSSTSIFSIAMIGNYFKIATRVLIKNKGYSFIHLVGLSIGLWACMMVATVVIDALSYDRQWSKADNIYRIITVNKRGAGLDERMASSAASLAPELVRNYSEAETYSSLYTGTVHFLMNKTQAIGIKTQVLHMDTTGLNILDIHILSGNPKVYVSGSSNIIISKSFKNKYFKNDNPVGRIIYDLPSYDSEANPFVIIGIMDDLPYNSHLRADVIWLHKNRIEPFSMDGMVYFAQNFLLMKSGTDMKQFTEKVNKWYESVVKRPNDTRFEFQPIKDIYLHSDFATGQMIQGNSRTIYIFSGVAALLLFIASINFINLSTGSAFTRLKEAGIRKVLSGSRIQLIIQILTETILLFAVSVVIAVYLYQVSLPSVEKFLGHQLIKTFTSNLALGSAAIIAVMVTSILTGLYPAWLISGLKPSQSLKGILTTSSFGKNWLRKSLVISQFSISIIVLIATIVVRQQLDLMENKDLGYNPHHLLTINNISWEGKSDRFKEQVLHIPGVSHASLTRWLPTQGGGSMTRDIEYPLHSGNKVKIWYISGDVDLPQTLGLKLTKGRLFGKSFSADVMNSDSLSEKDWEKYEEATKSQTSLLTVEAARILRVNTLNEQIKNANTVPIGIVENFNNESLYEPLKPTVILAQRSLEYGGMLVRVQPGMEGAVTKALEKLWKQFYAAKLLEIKSVEQMNAEQYEAESKMKQLFMFFSSLTMFLSALGIFGLAVQASEQRAKEVGIRKVLGSSVSGIVTLLSKDFVKLVLISIFIASPVAWYALQKWLQNYPYRTDISWWVYISAGLGAIFLTLVTVSFQAIRAALADPVKSLRSE